MEAGDLTDQERAAIKEFCDLTGFTVVRRNLYDEIDEF